MEKINLVCCVVFFASGFLLDLALTNQNEEKSLELDRDLLYSKRKPAAMWFGPRLGRRKRNPNFEDGYRLTPVDRQRLEILSDVLQDAPWAAFNEGKRHTVSFTPRLGRESGEEFLNGVSNGDSWIPDTELTGDVMSQRSPPFAPRLGRRLFPFSPRLGRENAKLQA